jgi:endogenous inhibitor of DNA gyrase (YacG/DUF329 family)
MAIDDIDNRLHAFKCPTCKAVSGLPAVNRSFPFCSERCRFIDLGRWVDGRYAINARTGKLDLVDPSNDEPDSEARESLARRTYDNDADD